MENWEQLIQEFSESAQSARLFCEQKGIKRTTFYYWLKKSRRPKDGNLLPAFIQIQKSFEGSLEIEYPNGVKVRTHGQPFSFNQLRDLIYV